MLTWVWQPGSLYEIRATWGWYWAGCGMVKIIIKQGGAEHINQKYILRVATQKCLFWYFDLPMVGSNFMKTLRERCSQKQKKADKEIHKDIYLPLSKSYS